MLAARRAIIFGSGELSPTDEHSLFASENGFVMLATVDDEIGLFLQKETFGHAMRCALCVCCLLSWVANSKCSTPNLGLLTGIKAGLDRWMDWTTDNCQVAGRPKHSLLAFYVG